METIQKEYLVKVSFPHTRGAKAEAAAIAAKRRSQFEALLEATFRLNKDDDSPTGRLCKLARSAAARANEELALDPQMGPWLEVSYGDPYPERLWAEELCAAQRKIRRLEREAAAQIEHSAMDTLIRLMSEDLTPDEAAAIVQAIPAAAELIPELKREDLNRERESEKALNGVDDLDEDDFLF